MSRNAKIGISVVIGLVVLCLCVCAGGGIALMLAGDGLLENMFVDDPDRARTMAHAIIDYDLPAGFQETSAMDFFYGTLVLMEGYSGADDDYGTLILVAQVEEIAGADTEMLRQQFEQAMQQQQVNWSYVGDEVITLSGQEVNVTTYEGESGDGGELLRQLSTDVFYGKSGMVFVSVIGPVDAWPQAQVDAFLESIR